MAIDLEILARQVVPQETVLVLGSGVSVPSGAPSGDTLRDELGARFGIDNYKRFGLADLTTIIEARNTRTDLISEIRKRIRNLQPTGGLLSIPKFDWPGIFSTNYDDLIEKAYQRQQKPLRVLSSNHDFVGSGITGEQELFKFHGTIEKDVSNGSNSRLIVTSTDYDKVTSYREILYSRLRDMMFSKSVLIVGQSLTDPDLRSLVDEAQKLKSDSGAPGKLQILVFERNDDLALVFEARGLQVCFGGIDELFSSLLKAGPAEQLVMSVATDVLGVAPLLEPATMNVGTELGNQTGHLERMFGGRAASYADIARGWTFDREIADQIEAQHLDVDRPDICVVLGVAGVGKTTAIRIALARLSERGAECWEHKADFAFEANQWSHVDDELSKRKMTGVLFVDDAHLFLREVNKLIEMLAAKETWSLQIILASSRPHWNPRLKSVELFKNCEERELSRLSLAEINGLLDLLESNKEIRKLVEDSFFGFWSTAKTRAAQGTMRRRHVCLYEEYIRFSGHRYHSSRRVRITRKRFTRYISVGCWAAGDRYAGASRTGETVDGVRS